MVLKKYGGERKRESELNEISVVIRDIPLSLIFRVQHTFSHYAVGVS